MHHVNDSPYGGQAGELLHDGSTAYHVSMNALHHLTAFPFLLFAGCEEPLATTPQNHQKPLGRLRPSADAARRFAEIQQAFEVLSYPDRRRRYDGLVIDNKDVSALNSCKASSPEFDFIAKPVLPAIVGKLSVTSAPETTACPTDFGLAFRAELQWLTIGLGAIIGTVHSALERNAMWNAQHVAGLMDGGLQCSPQKQSPVFDRAIGIAIARQ